MNTSALTIGQNLATARGTTSVFDRVYNLVRVKGTQPFESAIQTSN